jgi:3-deoxy-D-manno-octulosonate 8-phosphate phosphatase (KDO 8-P phosphatase)
VYQGVKNKAELLKKIAADKNIGLAQFAYIGDDTNDCECMKLIKEMGGLIGCPSDSSAQVLALADYVSGRSGGDGAVREFIEWL